MRIADCTFLSVPEAPVQNLQFFINPLTSNL